MSSFLLYEPLLPLVEPSGLAKMALLSQEPRDVLPHLAPRFGCHGNVRTYRRATETLSHGRWQTVCEPGARQCGT
jgi:hypothetical protein